MWKNRGLSIILILVSMPQISNASFFDERYRGWYWFDQLSTQEEKQEYSISHIEASNEIEELKNIMDKRRNIMIARPNAKNVIEYMKLEQQMWARALKLDEAFREAKFRYPEFFDKLNNPTNIHAVKLQRKIDHENKIEKIRQFAKNYHLVLFTKSGCKYSKIFAPILKKFGQEYNFSIEEVSINGKLTGYFPGKKMPNLASKLGIQVTPIIVAVSKDGSKAFEMIRGYASIAELEEYALLSHSYGENISRNIKGNS